jgi:DNA segregation ATPase FtsK/SpoIIIE-like protein
LLNSDTLCRITAAFLWPNAKIMGFIFQRRIRLGGGLGLNVSKSGLSPSLRTAFGTIGLSGISLRTGIPGFHWRKRWNSKNAGQVILILFGLWLAYVVIAVSLAVILYLLKLLFIVLAWLFLTIYDYCRYLYAVLFRQEDLRRELLSDYPATTDVPAATVHPALAKADPLLERAAHVIVSRQSATVADIQRSLGIGYNRSLRILEDAEAVAIIGPPDDNKLRPVYVDSPESLAAHFNMLRQGGDLSNGQG